jgi:hypothetical protein
MVFASLTHEPCGVQGARATSCDFRAMRRKARPVMRILQKHDEDGLHFANIVARDG